jgi:hypothetical protein
MPRSGFGLDELLGSSGLRCHTIFALTRCAAAASWNTTARSSRTHPKPAALPKELHPSGQHGGAATQGEHMHAEEPVGAKDSGRAEDYVERETRTPAVRHEQRRFPCGLTPELSRAAKRRRLGRFVRCHLV